MSGTVSSKTFTRDPVVRTRLNGCANDHAQNIFERHDNTGDHVSAIHAALVAIMPDHGISSNELENGIYGSSTANAVFRFKNTPQLNGTGKKILGPGQVTPDNIVGKQTIMALDTALKRLEPGPVPPPKPSDDQLVIEPSSDEFFEIAIDPDDVNKSDLSTTADINSFTLALLLIFNDLKDKSTESLQEDVKSELALAGSLGTSTAREFFRNTDPTGRLIKDRQPTELLSLLVEAEPAFVATAVEFETGLRKEITDQVSKNFLNWRLFKDKVTSPGLSFGGLGNLFTNNTLATLIGSFQGSRVLIRNFDADKRTRRFTSVLRYQFIDHFGADDSDATDSLPHGTDGQKALWFLQRFRHEKGGNFPFRFRVNIERKFDGTF